MTTAMTQAPQVSAQPLPVFVRPACPAEIGAVHAVDAESFAVPWSRSYIDDLFHEEEGRTPTLVATDSRGVVGFATYHQGLSQIAILRFAVRPEYRRRGVGGRLLAALTNKVHGLGLRRATAVVPERMVAAQVALRRAGFRWVATQPRGDVLTNEDLYVMDYLLTSGPDEEPSKWARLARKLGGGPR